MLFAVDIDGTIAESGRDQSALIRYMNRVLGIGLSEERMRQLHFCKRPLSAEIRREMETSEQEREKWQAYFSRFTFEGCPEVESWLAESDANQARYKEVERASQDDPELQAAKVPIMGAVEAMQQLARVGRLIYISLRNPATLDVTRDWLARHGFPSAEHTFCCGEFCHLKYMRAYEYAAPDERIILIDDYAREMMRCFRKLGQVELSIARSLLPRLSFVAYGAVPVDPIPEKLERFPVARILTWDSEQFRRWYREVSHELVQSPLQ